jgi:Fic family protein
MSRFRIKKYILESNAIEEIYGDKELKQSMFAWEYLKSLGSVLSHNDICRVQLLITANQEGLRLAYKGFYRSVTQVDVTVGDHEAPSWRKVDTLMEAWLLDLNKMSPLLAHIRFEYIHPFVDGNGRTGRMLYWWHCRKLNMEPFLYTEKEKEIYYRLFAKERVEKLIANNWGIEFGKNKWETTVRTYSGKLIRFQSAEKPKTVDIIKALPANEIYKETLLTKKIKE